jgi:hypothetical protein
MTPTITAHAKRTLGNDTINLLLQHGLYEGIPVIRAFPPGASPRSWRNSAAWMSPHANRQIKRRTRVIGLFSHENSVLRLVPAILMETSEEWETGKAYLTRTPQNRLSNIKKQRQTVA